MSTPYPAPCPYRSSTAATGTANHTATAGAMVRASSRLASRAILTRRRPPALGTLPWRPGQRASPPVWSAVRAWSTAP